MDRKHCGKRRNCSLRAISPFPTVFSKDLYYTHVQPGLVWERVNSLPNDKILDWSKWEAFADDNLEVVKIMIYVRDKSRKHCGKRRKCWFPAFSSFPSVFQKLS